MLQNLMLLISQHSFVEGLDDELLWKFETLGEYFVKSFSLQVVHNVASSMALNSQVRMVWKNLAPPRAELLVWFILLGRLSTKDKLSRFGCRSTTNPNYVLYSDNVESIDHLFFTCPTACYL